MSENNEEKTGLEKYTELILELDSIVRTRVLYQAIALEGVLDHIIAWHFCPDQAKHAAFFSLLFREGEITLANKTRILKKILKSSYPPLLRLFPKLFKALDEIRNLRNKFAHCELVLPEDLREVDLRRIKLKYYKDGQEIIEPVSVEAIEEQVEDCQFWHKLLLLFEMLIRQRVTGASETEAEKAAAQLWSALESAPSSENTA